MKSVVFDLDGVYFQKGTKEFLDEISKTYNLDRDDVVQAYLKSENMQKYKRGEIDGNKYWSWFIKELGIESNMQDILDTLMASYEVDDEVVEYVYDLKERGVRLGICTNNFPERFEGLCERFYLRDVFDIVVTSYEEGITKPDKEIFDILQERISLEKEDILMSDDREENVKMLNELGFKGVLYTNWEEFVNEVELFINPG